MGTTYFGHCWGVFEGGGVRASAHAGAYAAARAQGITFGRVAGTSAGSIVAALIAAGAEPEFITQSLMETPLRDFVGNPDIRASILTQRPGLLRPVARLSNAQSTVGRVARIATYSGLHSSEPIQKWMDDVLRKLLSGRRSPGETGPVTFRELKLPLHVVAADITAGRAKIWSREETPDDSVAMAVRCSCSIPFFYQAVGTNSSILLDGGIISNLPSFVFGRLDPSAGRSVLSRVLAFRLIENVPTVRVPPTDVLDFVTQLADTIVGGSTAIQQQLQSSIYTITINTGSIKSTDFDSIRDEQKRELHAAGHLAVEKFVQEERRFVIQSPSSNAYVGYDEKLLLLVQGMRSCTKSFWAVDKSTYWINFAFPTLLAAARSGIALNILTCKTTKVGELQSRRLLRRLGAQIIELDNECDLPFSGFLFDSGSQNASAILSNERGIVGADYDYNEEIVRMYTHSNDEPVLTSLASLLNKVATSAPGHPRNLPYRDCTKTELFERLRKVSQYKYAEFEMRQIDVSASLLVLQRSIKEFKLLQIRKHIESLLHASCSLFEPQKIVFDDASESIVTPPVLEELGNKLVVIEGNTRLFHCLCNNIRQIYAVVVRNVESPLPAVPFSIDKLAITSSTVSMNDNFDRMDRSVFRAIEKEVHADL